LFGVHGRGGLQLRRRSCLNPRLFKSVDLLLNHFMKSLCKWIGVAALTATIAFGADKVGVGKSFKGPLGLQLYSLRADFTKNVDMGLDLTKGFGFKDVELAGTYNLTPEQLREKLKERGLNPISGHFPYAKFKSDPESIAKDAKALGLKYAGCAWADHKDDYDLAEAKETVEVFNNAGKVLAKHGIQFFYHCHGFEFAPNGSETFMDYLIKNTDPKHVAYEMDVFWVVHPGHDPVKWLEKYPGRWELMHVKDMRKGTETGKFTGGTDVKNDVAIGTGLMDWPAILKAAKKSGVKYYFIEDESPTVKDQIPVSLKYLSEVRF
jgi:sugar phosphate isomerase/epimerase